MSQSKNTHSKIDVLSQGRSSAPSTITRPTEKEPTVAAVLEEDEENQINAVDIRDDIEAAIDDNDAAAEEDAERDGQERVEKAAKANQR